MPYLHVSGKWVESALAAVSNSDPEQSLLLLRELFDEKKKNPLSTIGVWDLVSCIDCEYYIEDDDPIDPGWPMMCEETGRDMVEPYGTCFWGIPRIKNADGGAC